MTKRPKAADPTAVDLLVPARATREKVDEFHPMVLYSPRHGQAFMAALDAGDTLDVMLAATLAEMRAQLGPPEWIAVTTDAYVKKVESLDEVPERRLGEAFLDGDPNVIEQMVVILRHRYKPTQTATQTYRYLPSEGWEWDEVELVENNNSPVLDVLNYYIV